MTSSSPDRAEALEPHFERAEAASDAVAEKREDARAASILAIRALENRLRDALAGGPLRGLPRIGPGAVGYYAARVRGKNPAVALVPGERPVLVLSSEGRLMMASVGGEGWTAIRALDDDLLVEDVVEVARVLRVAIAGHLSACGRSASRYSAVEALSKRIVAILSEADAAIG